MGMKTAYIELNTTNQIKSLSIKHSLKPFVYMGIHMYPSTKVTSLMEILNKEFDYFILDMGVLTNYTAAELSKCHKQFLVCDFCQWKKAITLEKMDDLFQNSNLCKKSVTILTRNKSTDLILSNFDTKTLPFISNPFHLPLNHSCDFSQMVL